MSTNISVLAGKPAPSSLLIDVQKLVAAYMDLRPDPSVPAQRVVFGTSGHRGNSFECSFNEWHVLAITQAICEYRKSKNIDGPLYIGIDTHALSQPAFESALEVLAANNVETIIAKNNEFTPTPVISHAILTYNHKRTTGLADGIVITPSHNPPSDGGFKYNPPNGGPASTDITNWIEKRANKILETALKDVKRMPFLQARCATNTHEHDFLNAYVADLNHIIDFDIIRHSGIHMGVDPLGGAGVHCWAQIAQRYKINLKVINEKIDPTFSFMSVDWDGQIRMDPSSLYAMTSLIKCKDDFDVAFACDTDHDRHGIVTPSGGLLNANHYLCVMIDYLFKHRPDWCRAAAIGKTVVSTALIDRIAKKCGRKLYETPVGFKWFVDGLFNSSLGFAGEESAGASFLRKNGRPWTTDKDGIAAALLSAEITARCGSNPAILYNTLTHDLGEPIASRIEVTATTHQKIQLLKISPQQIKNTTLAGEKINTILSDAPGNNAPIGGIKVTTANGWFAVRPSGTEAIYKIYAESFKDKEHLQLILQEAQHIVDAAITA